LSPALIAGMLRAMSAPPYSIWPSFIAAIVLMLLFGAATELMLAAATGGGR